MLGLLHDMCQSVIDLQHPVKATANITSATALIASYMLLSVKEQKDKRKRNILLATSTMQQLHQQYVHHMLSRH